MRKPWHQLLRHSARQQACRQPKGHRTNLNPTQWMSLSRWLSPFPLVVSPSRPGRELMGERHQSALTRVAMLASTRSGTPCFLKLQTIQGTWGNPYLCRVAVRPKHSTVCEIRTYDVPTLNPQRKGKYLARSFH